MNAAQRSAFYYSRKRRRLHNQRLVVQLTPRSAALDHTSPTTQARFMSGVNLLDNGEGTSSASLSGANASDFQLNGLNLELKSGVSLVQGAVKVVNVDGTNAVKGDASNTFTLRIT